MAIFQKIRDIVSASIDDLLAKAEDPERTVNQMIREMGESIVKLRKETASAMAMHKLLAKKLERTKAECGTWQANAEYAVRKERDDLAKKALARKQSLEALVKTLEGQLAESEGLAQRLKEELRRVEDKAQDARAKRNTLITKKRLAQYRNQLVQGASRAIPGPATGFDVIDGFDKLQEKIDREVAELEALQELNEEIRGAGVEEELGAMRREENLEEELKRLKERLKDTQ